MSIAYEAFIPLRADRTTSDKAYAAPRRPVGFLVTSGGAACTVLVRDGVLATDAVVFTLKVDAANKTVPFILPGIATFAGGFFVDVDANTLEVTTLYVGD